MALDLTDFVIIIIALAGVAFWVASVWAAIKRLEEMAALAASLGLRWSERDPFGLARRYSHFSALDKGHNRSASNVIHGRLGEVDIAAFDYTYHTTETSRDSKGRTTTREVAHTFSAIACDTRLSFQPLVIRPEGLLDRLAGVFGMDDIDFESNEFNRAFYVNCPDKKFAYGVVHPRMMEYLLANSGWSLDIRGQTLLIHSGYTLSAAAFKAGIGFILGFLNQLPEYLKQGMQGSAPE